MPKLIVNQKVIRDLVKEALDCEITDEPQLPINKNNVVDQLAIATDPSNLNYTPQNKQELSVAINTLAQDLPDSLIPDIYNAALGAAKKVTNDSSIEIKQDKKMNDKEKKVEETIRAAVRKVLAEMGPLSRNYVDPADLEAEEEEQMHRKNATMVDVGGASFQEIAKELGYSVAGAKQAVDKALLKAQFMGQMAEEDREIIVLTAMNDYIRMLSKSGELSSADVMLLKSHPDIIRELDGFREFLHKYVQRARKTDQKLENPLGEQKKA